MTTLIPKTRAALLGLSSVGALFLIGATTTAAFQGNLFPGGDAALQQASANGDDVSLHATGQISGVQIAVTHAVIDEARTALGVVVVGAPELGEGVFPVEPPILVGQSGKTYQLRGQSANQSDRRQLTWLFPPVDAPDAGSLVLEVRGLELYSVALAKNLDGSAPPTTKLNGVARIELPIGLERAEAEHRPVNQSFSLGNTTLDVDEVLSVPSGVVVRGRISGVSANEIPNLLLRGNLSGSESTYMRMGFGPAREQFEMVFPPDASGELELQLLAGERGDSVDTLGSARLMLP